MKRLIWTLLILCIALVFTACGEEAVSDTQPTPDAEETPSVAYDEAASAQDGEGGEEFSRLVIGYCLGGEGAFYNQLKADIQRESTNMNYDTDIRTAQTAKEQIDQIRAMLSVGVPVIVIDPVDVDALESVLAECETQHVPVINILDSINGKVSTLIAPNYNDIGKSAGRDAIELYGETKAECMMLKSGYGSFNMQLLSDGFNEEINKDKDVTLVSEQFCGDDEDQAYAATKEALSAQGSTVNFIFAQSDKLGVGALKAIEELQAQVTLVVFGGDITLVSAAAEDKIHSCIFFGPAQLAAQVVDYADRMIKDTSYVPPQYFELRIEAAQGDDADDYASQDGLHAQIIGE